MLTNATMETVLTGGKFNMIHRGHIHLLKKARSLGDRLVVVLAHDSRNRRSYALPASQRKEMLLSTGLVDEVVVGHESDFSAVIEKYKPSVIVLGYDQELPPGVKEKLGKARVVKMEKYGDYSTSAMAGKMHEPEKIRQESS